MNPLKVLRLFIQRRVALANIPRDSRGLSYAFFDCWVRLGGAREVFRLFKDGNQWFLDYQITDLLQEGRQAGQITLDSRVVHAVFDSLKLCTSELKEPTLVTFWCKDPVRLRYFARDRLDGWGVELSVEGLQESKALCMVADNVAEVFRAHIR